MVLSAVAFCESQTPFTCGLTLGPVVCGQGMTQEVVIRRKKVWLNWLWRPLGQLKRTWDSTSEQTAGSFWEMRSAE